MIKNDDFIYNLNKPLMMSDTDDDELFADDDLDSDLNSKDDSSDTSSSGQSEGSSRNSTGITRNSLGFGLLSFAGLIPTGLLMLYMTSGLGLSLSAMIFMVCFLVGVILSVWTFFYYRSGNSSFTKFDVHSFFKWPEIITISIILLGMSFLNLASLSSGGMITLSAESTLNAKGPAPMFAPKPPSDTNFEENEVLYESKEFTPVTGVKKSKPVNNYVPSQPKRRVVSSTYVKPVAKTVSEPVRNTDNVVKAVSTKPTLSHEDEEGRTTTQGKSTSNGKDASQVIDEAASFAETSIPKVKENVEPSTNTQPVSAVAMEIETPGTVSSLFLGGVLCAALGYAFPLAFAGAILGLFRRFSNPFSAKTKELINEETGEVTLETEEQSGANKILDLVFRFFVGFNIGGTAGFILGLVITLPLYMFFWDKAQAEPMVANILMTMGVVKNPDLAYSTGLIVAGMVVPFVMLVIGKSSPAGMSITEEEVRQVYSPVVTINKVSTEVSTIPEPAIVSFNVDDDEEDGVSVDDFSDDPKESLTGELLSEFGVDLEDTFGMEVRLPAKTNGNGNGHLSDFEKQKVTSILENSLGELGNVTVQVSAELGKATIMLTDWLNLTEGTLIELDKPVSQEIDILINDVCKGKGKLTVVDNNLAVKVSKANFSQSKN